MALVYMRNTIQIESGDVIIRPIKDDADYRVAITFNQGDEDEVTEVVLTKEEVEQVVDAAFNQ